MKQSLDIDLFVCFRNPWFSEERKSELPKYTLEKSICLPYGSSVNQCLPHNRCCLSIQNGAKSMEPPSSSATTAVCHWLGHLPSLGLQAPLYASPAGISCCFSGFPQHSHLNLVLALSTWGGHGLCTYLSPCWEQLEVRGGAVCNPKSQPLALCLEHLMCSVNIWRMGN